MRDDDPLVRAIGKQAGVRTVVDATAGLGRDSAALARAGFEVTAMERAPALVALWTAARMPSRLAFVPGDALALLSALAPADAPDVVYLDPMYPDPPGKKRKSAPEKALVDLRALVGDDADAPQLLAIARAVARMRVVVKRPKRAPPLAPPSHSWEGASTRYDLYLRAAAALASSV